MGDAHPTRIINMNIQNALKIRGWMSPKELEWLAETASHCMTIIEVGCFEGRSTRAMADNTTGIIHAVDPWNALIYGSNGQFLYKTDDITRSIFHANLADKIGDGTIEVWPTIFKNFRPILMDQLQPSFIFIDAAHDYENVKNDINHAMTFKPIMIGGHDYCKEWPGVIKAVDEIFPNAEKEDTIWYQKLKY